MDITAAFAANAGTTVLLFKAAHFSVLSIQQLLSKSSFNLDPFENRVEESFSYCITFNVIFDFELECNHHRKPWLNV